MMERLLLTGAAGTLGRMLRPRLAAHCRRLRLSDRELPGDAAPHEELMPAALEDRAAVHRLLEGVDAVVHLGGVSVEAAFAPILDANISGLFHLYEAARHHGVRRIVFASSNHVVGYYRQDEVIDTHAPMRPDTLYGVSKAFGETLSRFYFDRHGIETVCLRIGSCTPAPENRRMLATWLSHDDLERLVVRALTAPRVGHLVVFATSDNAVRWWDNRHAAPLGFQARDSADPHRARIEAADPHPDPNDPLLVYQGGSFVQLGPYDEPPPPPSSKKTRRQR
jgi:uronate dehydrogenase